MTPSRTISAKALPSRQATVLPEAMASRMDSPWVSNLDADTAMSAAL